METKRITIKEAINMVVNEGISLWNKYFIITDFDPKKLVFIKGVYCHNYYDYEGTILLQESDDDCEETYIICDKDFNQIGELGNRTVPYMTGDPDEICELYTWS